MNEIGSWDRTFQLWQYSVSHSLLLLRSFHPQRYSTRIDVAFASVSEMKVAATYERLTVQEAEGRLAHDTLGREPLGHETVYLLNGGAGYVCATRCAWHEDDGNHKTPSKFGPLRGTA
ncbi:hypothetical protein [Streptomyces avicenniae]|uniref:hypothetical protein n=1 Tax=Streptomyces avicenniae TaxID=500153 RepID=UPI00069AE15E|nr:hypothetical protein [Streptomyces avicenniae]